MSSSIDDTIITEEEFTEMVRIYDSAMKNDFKNDNINNVARVSTTSTDSRKHHPEENEHDINNINKP